MPTVSRAIAAANGEILMVQELCAANGETRLVVDGSLDGGSHPSASHLEKCGYCSLLSHSPALADFSGCTSVLIDAPIAEKPARFYSAAPRLFAWTASLARAPPRSLDSLPCRTFSNKSPVDTLVPRSR
ncbi:MAG: DUF2946 domain-containing protein, partial [Burkholderiales bacterium]